MTLASGSMNWLKLIDIYLHSALAALGSLLHWLLLRLLLALAASRLLELSRLSFMSNDVDHRLLDVSDKRAVFLIM